MLTKKKTILFLIVVAVLALMVTMASAHGGTRHFTANLMELNGSGVQGTADITLDGEELTVRIQVSGLEAGKTHAQHIHGFAEPSNRTCPTSAADVDGDGLVSVGEGVPFYGPVRLPLTPFPAVTDGAVDYQQTFTDSALDDLRPLNTLQNRAIVLHGLTVGDSYIGSLPVACGQIAPAPNGP